MNKNDKLLYSQESKVYTIKICNKPKQAILKVRSLKSLSLEAFRSHRIEKHELDQHLLSVLHFLLIPLPIVRTTLISSWHIQITHIYQKLIVNKQKCIYLYQEKTTHVFYSPPMLWQRPYLSLLVFRDFKALLFCGKTPSQMRGLHLGDECSYMKKN